MSSGSDEYLPSTPPFQENTACGPPESEERTLFFMENKMNIIAKLLHLLSLNYAYGCELNNGDKISYSLDRGLVFYEKFCKNYRDGYAYDIHCVNDESEEYLEKLLNKVKNAIIRDIKAY